MVLNKYLLSSYSKNIQFMVMRNTIMNEILLFPRLNVTDLEGNFTYDTGILTIFNWTGA